MQKKRGHELISCLNTKHMNESLCHLAKLWTCPYIPGYLKLFRKLVQFFPPLLLLLFQVTVNTNITDLREYLDHLIASTNMKCLTPEKVCNPNQQQKRFLSFLTAPSQNSAKAIFKLLLS